ncbi:unnamed protein product, partial [Rotaria sp. Silwood1]
PAWFVDWFWDKPTKSTLFPAFVSQQLKD